MQNEDYVLIYETMSPVELSICRQMLEESGISTVEHHVVDPWVSSVMRDLVAPRLVLLVRREDAEKAAQVVEDFREHAATQIPPAEEEASEAKPPYLTALFWARLMIWTILLAAAAGIIFAVVMAVRHQ